MKDVSLNNKRTVIFVSHNMEAISQLCTKVILLKNGEIVNMGKPEVMINEYLNLMTESNSVKSLIEWTNLNDAPGNQFLKMLHIGLKDNNGQEKVKFSIDQEINIEFKYKLLTNNFQISSYIAVSKLDGTPLFNSLDEYVKGKWGEQENHQQGEYLNNCKIPPNILGEGSFNVNLRIFSPPNAVNHSDHVRLINIMTFQVVDELDDKGARGSYPFNLSHPLRPKLEWKLRRIK